MAEIHNIIQALMGKDFDSRTVAQGLALALNRAPTARRQVLISLDEDSALRLVQSVMEHVRKKRLVSMGDVKEYVLGQRTITVND